MENKLFTTVAIEDKHVGEPHVAFTENGACYFGEIWLDNTRLKWYCEVDEDFQPCVTHVLEEVTWPTIEEMKESLGNNGRYEEYRDIYDDGYEDGANDGYIQGFNEALNRLR